MDSSRFDALARTMAARFSRRVALRGAATTVGAALLATTRKRAQAQAATPKASTSQQVCSDPARPGVGCACTTGAHDPCGNTTLLCCQIAPNGPPGGSGTCTPASVGCTPLGTPTACVGIGCPCLAGVEGTCTAGLVCCQSQMTAPNKPGGPGQCAAPAGCGNASATPAA